MTEKPFISVVIPCYNDGEYLPETIARLKEQTYPNFEIILVNDGSTDQHTLDVLKQLETEGVQVFHKENGRMSSARNYGAKQAKGSIIAALDADDYFDPSFLKKPLPYSKPSPK